MQQHIKSLRKRSNREAIHRSPVSTIKRRLAVRKIAFGNWLSRIYALFPAQQTPTIKSMSYIKVMVHLYKELRSTTFCNDRTIEIDSFQDLGCTFLDQILSKLPAELLCVLDVENFS